MSKLGCRQPSWTVKHGVNTFLSMDSHIADQSSCMLRGIALLWTALLCKIPFVSCIMGTWWLPTLWLLCKLLMVLLCFSGPFVLCKQLLCAYTKINHHLCNSLSCIHASPADRMQLMCLTADIVKQSLLVVVLLICRIICHKILHSLSTTP